MMIRRLLVSVAVLLAVEGARANADTLNCGLGCPVGTPIFTYTQYFDYPFLAGRPEAHYFTDDQGDIAKLFKSTQDTLLVENTATATPEPAFYGLLGTFLTLGGVIRYRCIRAARG